MGSLRTRILIAVSGVVIATTVAILYLVQRETERAVFRAQNASIRNLVSVALLNVESLHQSLLFQEAASLALRKSMVENVTLIAIQRIRAHHAEAQAGKITHEEAQRRAIDELAALRYDEGVGYLWINDTGRPIPTMIMHPTVPHLVGRVLDEPEFDGAEEGSRNAFRAMVDVCMRDGAGFVRYLWPKPTPDGLTTEQPKISHVRLFEPWGWVIGTGVYVDDIEADARRRLDAAVKELERSFGKIMVAESGYMFLFAGDGEMLIHPSLVGADFSKLLNPATGNPILDDLIAAARTPEKHLDYVWEKPPSHRGEFVFPKRAYVEYYEPLDWYIASSVYDDEIAAPALALRKKALLPAAGLLVAALLLSVWLSKGLVKPLQRLMRSAKEIEHAGLRAASIPVTGPEETRELGTILGKMMTSIEAGVAEKEKLLTEVETANADLTRTNDELQRALEEVHTLRGLLPICSFCKKIRDDEGYWQQIESHLSARSDLEFSHGICPECLEEHYGDVEKGTP
jgi:signal transduction histidine kinase